jgi:hypothetical protein
MQCIGIHRTSKVHVQANMHGLQAVEFGSFQHNHTHAGEQTPSEFDICLLRPDCMLSCIPKTARTQNIGSIPAKIQDTVLAAKAT